MAGVFNVVLVVCIVHNALEVALVVADFEGQFVNVFFHVGLFFVNISFLLFYKYNIFCVFFVLFLLTFVAMKQDLLIYSAPLQGFTEVAWRNAHARVFGGVAGYYTPFVRLEKGVVRNKDRREVSQAANSVEHLVPQLMRSEEHTS